MNWHAVVSKASAESKANQELIELGLPTFYPRDRVRRIRHTRRGPVTEWVELAHFSRYLFVQARARHIRSILACRFIQKLVTFGDEPTMIPDYVMSVLMAGVNELGVMGTKDEVTRKRFEAMQDVRFKSGPFAGFVAQVLDDNGKDDIRLLVQIFGQANKVTVPVSGIELLEPA